MPSKFKYPLASLKKLRQMKLDMAKADLAAIGSQLNEIDQKIVGAKQNMSELLTDSRQTSDVTYVKLFSELSSLEKDRIKSDMKKREFIQSEFDRHSSYVSFLNSEFKAVELHENSKKEEFNTDLKRRNEKALDEVVSIIQSLKKEEEL